MQPKDQKLLQKFSLQVNKQADVRISSLDTNREIREGEHNVKIK